MGVPKSYSQDKFHIETCTKFCSEVESLITTSNKQADEAAMHGRNRPRLRYVDSVLMIAEKWNIEEALAATYLSPDIKDKIRVEAEARNSIPRSASLPF